MAVAKSASEAAVERLADEAARAERLAQDAARALAEHRQREDEARSERFRDHARLTLASFDGDVQAATERLHVARRAFAAAAPTADAAARYLELARAQMALGKLYTAASNARGRLGMEPRHDVPERAVNVDSYSKALDQAMAAHVSRLSADLEDEYQAELQAVTAGEQMKVDDCPICQNPRRKEIDIMLATGAGLLAVADRFGLLALLPLAIHKKHCLEPATAAQSDAAPAPAQAPAEPPKPARKPRFLKPFLLADMPDEQFAALWFNDPAKIGRSCSVAERHNPAVNPLHPYADSQPPGTPRDVLHPAMLEGRMRGQGWGRD